MILFRKKQFSLLMIMTIILIGGFTYLKYIGFVAKETRITLRRKIIMNFEANRHEPDFKKKLSDRLDSLTKRKAHARDVELIQLVRDMMVPPYEMNAHQTNPVNELNTLVAEVNSLLKNESEGFFVECGALDGVKASNTLYFERYKQWNGLLIEMDPDYFAELLTKKRQAWSINACVSPFDYAIKLPYKGKGPETPQLLMDETSLGKNTSQLAACFPLETFLLALHVQTVDFFCFDIEGLELQILKTFPFDRFDMKILSVECLPKICKEQEFKDFMKSNGYETHKLISLHTSNAFMRDFIFYKSLMNIKK